MRALVIEQFGGAALLVPMAVKFLKHRSAHTTVHLEDGLIEQLIERLDLGQLDLVIGSLDAITDSTGLALETLYQDAVAVAGFAYRHLLH